MKLITQQIRPPRLATKILELAVPVDYRENIVGDLFEEYGDSIHLSHGKLGADVWFWKQTLLTSYEFLNKQKGGIMAFMISIVVFVSMLAMAMWMGAQFGAFFNLPSFLVTILPAFCFGIAATSYRSFKNSVKLTISEQANVTDEDALSAIQFLKVAGNSGLWLGGIGTIIGAIAIGSNMEPASFGQHFGPAFAVCVLTLLYTFCFKVICYVAEQKITYLYLTNKQAH